MFVIRKTNEELFLSGFNTETGEPIWGKTAKIYLEKRIASIAIGNACKDQVVSFFSLKPETIDN
jgi:hypothetical protein